LVVKIKTPVGMDQIKSLNVGDQLVITGTIYTGRDAALPRLVKAIQESRLGEIDIHLEGGIIFHSAVSIAGVGPTSSNKVEIEESIPVLSQAGIRIHIGKGALSPKTVKALQEFHSIFAVTPPASALLTQRIVSKRVVAFPEEGMEAIHELVVREFPVIVAISQGRSVHDKEERKGDDGP
jgi:fumarate hydratase subunit beta